VNGRTLTVLNDFSSSAGGQQVGKYTEVWVRQYVLARTIPST
jgi:hypothetical protein